MSDGNATKSARTLRLEALDLSPAAQVAWVVYCGYFLRQIGANHRLEFLAQKLDARVAAFLSSGFLEHNLDATLAVHAKREPDVRETFALLSSSRMLSRKLVTRFDTIYLAPRDLPACVDAAVYWQDVAERKYLTLLRDALGECGWSDATREFALIRREFSPSRPRVALATSIYNGDRFLQGFLENIARLSGYEQYEHFLVRANSPGNEHDVLVRFVRRNGSAIYINLEKDPGLYEVWNIVASLTTARLLSNANLDDRRHPEHVLKLARIFDEKINVDVASARVRVSECGNLDWPQARGLRVFFGGRSSPRGSYTFDRLVRELPDGTYAANNIPHCMPLWRRELHARFGYFNEREFGPSADWEFWLRCGVGGAGFYLYPKPLGLYFRSTDSYWHRSNGETDFDGRILDAYLRHCFDENADVRALLIGRSVKGVELDRLEKAGAWFDLFARLACSALIGAASYDGKERQVVDEYAMRHFGVERFCSAVSVPVAHRANEVPTARQIFDCAVYCLAGCKQVPSDQSIGKKWQFLFIDYYEMCSADDALIPIAYLYHRRGERTEAWRLLREAYMRTDQFWPVFQALFRFEYGAREALENLEAGNPSSIYRKTQGVPCRVNVWFYPAYQDNPYQALLYQPLIESGVKVVGLRGLNEVYSIATQTEENNVLHLHWIHEVFKRATTRSDMQTVSSKFLNKLRRLKRRGVRVVWVVHNYLSHDARWPSEEWQFRRSLAAEVDELIVHHPMVRDLLDWLPDTVSPHVVEHGSYGPVECWTERRGAARQKFGLRPEDQLIVYFGKVRPYKQLERYLPHLIEWVKRERAARLYVLGKLYVREVRDIVEQASTDRVLLREGHIPKDELDDYLDAADWGFLSYRSILTSGSMFYMLSRGLPVIAPNQGTIPAYVINGWNGYVYEGVESLRALLRAIGGLGAGVTDRMHDNALSLAKKLDWRFD